MKVDIIGIEDKNYPQNLKYIYDPPKTLYVKGKITEEDRLAVAIIGTRRPSLYGMQMAEHLATDLSQRGITIVSGGARGIDSCAHRAAIKAGARTICVLGCGIDIVYPPENRGLFEDISQSGAVISEFEMSTPPNKYNFPRRNRLISGLSLGVVVVEAAEKSGTMTTVTHALEQGREIFSVPGRADTATSKGTNRLLKEGAKLIESADDIISELEPLKVLKNLTCRKALDLQEPEKSVYDLISFEPVQFDDILQKSNLQQVKIYSVLTSLELKQAIKRLPGNYFIRKD